MSCSKHQFSGTNCWFQGVYLILIGIHRDLQGSIFGDPLINQPRVQGMSASENYTRRIHRTGISTHIYHENQSKLSKYIPYTLHVGSSNMMTSVPRVSPTKRPSVCCHGTPWGGQELVEELEQNVPRRWFHPWGIWRVHARTANQRVMKWDPYFEKIKQAANVCAKFIYILSMYGICC